jgi:hypothetical protein
MKILNLFEELEDIIDTAATVPLSGKKILDKEEIFEIIKDMKLALPDEIQEAKLIVEERDKMLAEAEKEFERRMNDAHEEHERLIDENLITQKATDKANKLLDDTEAKTRELKVNTYSYLDKMLYDFQERISALHEIDFNDMFAKFQASFATINDKLENNRAEITELANKAQHEVRNR